jgi:heat shock protein HtpX
MGLQIRMFLLVGVLFAILYGVLSIIGTLLDVDSLYFSLILAVGFLGLQYLMGPFLVGRIMRVKWVTEQEEPELHRMVEKMATVAGIHKPRIGISQISTPNAFAYGLSQRDGRICVTEGALKLLNHDELQSVVGHELSHLQHRDMAVIALISVVPVIIYYVLQVLSRFSAGSQDSSDGDSEGGGVNPVLVLALVLFVIYFVTELLVLYGSRIREYYADRGSIKLGNQPQHLASALLKLTSWNARMNHGPDIDRVASVKAFFINDPSVTGKEISKIEQICRDQSGIIRVDEMQEIRHKHIKIGVKATLSEVFQSHPNILKRIKALSEV